MGSVASLPGRAPSAGRLMPATPLSRKPPGAALPLGEGHRDEARLAAALHAHQDAVLVVGLRRVDGLADIAGGAHALAADFENHVTFLEAAFGRGTLRIDLGDHDAVLAGTGDGVRGRHRHAELRHVGALARALAVVV